MMRHTARSGYLLVTAGDAGGTDGPAVRAALSVLAADAPTALRTSTDARDLDAALDDLGDRQLVVAGGDGTVHLMVRALLDRGAAGSTPLGVVPLGTGNDLARGVGLSLEPARAARRVVAGTAQPMDILRRDGAVAVNAAHIGFGVAAARRAERLKPLLGAYGYRAGAVWAGLVENGIPVSVEVDGDTVADGEPLLLVAVMNGPTVGGGTPLCPAADPVDGVLDVVVAADRGRPRRGAFALALRRGRHLELPGVAHRRGRVVCVRTPERCWDVDGELVDGPLQSRWEIETAAWQLLV